VITVKLKIGRILHLKSEIRNLKSDWGARLKQPNLRFRISDLRCRIRPISKCNELLVLLVLFSPAAVQTPGPGTLTSALADLNKGNVLEAIDKLKRIASNDAAFGPANFYLATLYTEMKAYEIAGRYLQRAVAANSNQGSYQYQLGVIRLRQERWHEALARFEEALKSGVGKDEAVVWRSIGDVQLKLFERDKALEAYEKAVRIQPADARARLALGQFYLERNDLEKALPELRAAVEIDPKLTGAYASLGQAYRRRGDPASAVVTLKRAIEIFPADQTSRYILGQTLVAMGRRDEGREELDRYQRTQDQVSRAGANFEAAAALAKEGQLDRAGKLFREAVDLAPTYGPGLEAFGVFLLDRGDHEKAVEIFKRAAAANPLYSAAYFGLGSAYLRLGNLAQALEQTRRAIVLYDEDARYHRQIGDIFTKMNRPEDARMAFETAAELESR
jgi:tetratricopeptide (TPR) repeat protein